MTRAHRLGLIAGAIAALIAGTLLLPHSAKGALKAGACFHGSDISNWSAPDSRTIYLRVFASRYYRIDLSRECSPLRWPDAHLVTSSHGSDLICTLVDLELKASEGPGAIPEPCFVKSLTALSPGEAALLPKGAKP
jgi:hypothetical protein